MDSKTVGVLVGLQAQRGDKVSLMISSLVGISIKVDLILCSPYIDALIPWLLQLQVVEGFLE